MIQIGDHVLVALAQEVRPPPALQREPTWYHAVVLGLRTAGGKPLDGLALDAFPVKCRRVRVWAKIAFHEDPKGRALHVERGRPRPSPTWDAIRLPTAAELERFRRDPRTERDAFHLLRTLALQMKPARAAEILGISEQRLLEAEAGGTRLDWDRAREALRRGAREGQP
jgi:hypothetical protein